MEGDNRWQQVVLWPLPSTYRHTHYMWEIWKYSEYILPSEHHSFSAANCIKAWPCPLIWGLWLVTAFQPYKLVTYYTSLPWEEIQIQNLFLLLLSLSLCDEGTRCRLWRTITPDVHHSHIIIRSRNLKTGRNILVSFVGYVLILLLFTLVFLCYYWYPVLVFATFTFQNLCIQIS